MSARVLLPALLVGCALPAFDCAVLVPGCAVLLSGCAVLLSGCARRAAPDGDIQHVVVLILDGVRLEETLGAGTSDTTGEPTVDFWPRIRSELLPVATVVDPLFNAGITITSPAHCNLATGARLAMGNFVATEGLGYYLPDIPTVFEEVARSGRRGMIVSNTDLVYPMAYSVYPGGGDGAETIGVTEEGSDRPSIDDEPVLDEVFTQLRDAGPALLVANLHSADRAGHEGEETEYPERVKRYDDILVDFWASIQGDSTLSGHTLLVVTADHGRHNNGADAGWRNHGDGCSGCRSMPMIWLGPGVADGATVSGAYTLDDLTATVSAVLGVTLPYGEGRVMTEVLPEVAASAPTGEDNVDGEGPLLTRRWAGEGRTVIEVDGVSLSSPAATLAEAGRIATGGGHTYACWRELTLAKGQSAPWVPRCAEQAGSDWVDIGYPDEEVGAVWEPSMTVGADGVLQLAVLTSISMAVADDGGVRLYTYDGAWTHPGNGVDFANFATYTALAASGDTTYVAFTNSLAGAEDGRFTRHVELRGVGRSGADQVWTPLYEGLDGVDTEGVTWDRRERPAVSVTDDTLELAMIGYGAAGTTVLRTSSVAGTTDWSTLERVDDTGRVLPAVPPRYRDGVLLWARLAADEEVEVCALGGALTCLPTGAPTIRGLTVGPDGVYASLGDLTWETTLLAL